MVCAKDERIVRCCEDLESFGFCGYDEEVVRVEG